MDTPFAPLLIAPKVATGPKKWTDAARVAAARATVKNGRRTGNVRVEITAPTRLFLNRVKLI
jgi:hypothetical protein